MTQQNKPWFGSKRVGVGIRPQTWQGWLVVVLAVVVLVVVIRLVTG
ncbi:hypothetical protein [Flexivirga meconopsidis]|nr:hypothetical protein [Flexivirga meconopsidis]